MGSPSRESTLNSSTFFATTTVDGGAAALPSVPALLDGFWKRSSGMMAVCLYWSSTSAEDHSLLRVGAQRQPSLTFWWLSLQNWLEDAFVCTYQVIEVESLSCTKAAWVWTRGVCQWVCVCQHVQSVVATQLVLLPVFDTIMWPTCQNGCCYATCSLACVWYNHGAQHVKTVVATQLVLLPVFDTVTWPTCPNGCFYAACSLA